MTSSISNSGRDDSLEVYSRPHSAQEYYKLVTDELESTTETILGYYTLPNQAPFTKAACVHQYVSSEVGGRSSPRDPFREVPIRPPMETLSEGGNCEEQSILFASLLQQIPEVKTRLMVVGRQNDSNHALVEVHVPDLSLEAARDHLIAVHNRNPNLTNYPEHIQGKYHNGDDLWLPADPALSAFIGDVQPHTKMGFVVQSPDGWDWYQIHDKGRVLG